MAKSFGPLFFGIPANERQRLLEFLLRQTGARRELTDSRGVREETCILGVPCVTLKENTERPETVDVGANDLAGVCALRCQKRSIESYLSEIVTPGQVSHEHSYDTEMPARED